MQPRPRRRILPPQQNVYVEFEPSAEWAEEPSSHILRLQLPGFKMEEVRVTPEKSGKITVWGRRQAGAFRITGFERSYDVPKDSNLEKMTWIINDGVLELTVPKTAAAVEPEKVDVPFEEKKKEQVLIADGPKATVEGRKEETVQPNEINVAEAAAGLSEMNREPTMKEPKMAVEERKEAEEEEAAEAAAAAMIELKDIVEEPKPEKKVQIAAEESKEEVATYDKPKMLEDKKEANQKEVVGSIDEKMIEEEEALKRTKEETMQECQSERFAEKNDKSAKKEEPEKPRHCYEGLQESQEKKDRGKRRWPWKEGEKRWLGWFDCEFIDGVLKKVTSNGKLITIALVVFSTGLYITKKLRKRG